MMDINREEKKMSEPLCNEMYEGKNQPMLNSEDNELLQELYRSLGEQYYKGAFEDPLPQLLPIFDKITSLFKKYEKTGKKCKNCGAELEEDAKFCEVCGTSVEEEQNKAEGLLETFCSNCGKPLKPEAKFCGNCGTPVK